MAKKVKARFSREDLIKRGFPAALVTSILLLASAGVTKLSDLDKVSEYKKWEMAHPMKSTANKVIDGDTFEIDNGGRTVRLLGVNAPDRGNKGHDEARGELSRLIERKIVWLEYDRYQDDPYGRLLAWVWIKCENEPEFLSFDYMHKSGNESQKGIKENPKGCKKGVLVNEELTMKGLVKTETFKDRGELKYEERLKEK